MAKNIYLDYNASTPIALEAVEAMRPFLTQHYGNPSSLHWAGVPAKDAVERARAQVAGLLDCDPTEVIFPKRTTTPLKGCSSPIGGAGTTLLPRRWSTRPPSTHAGSWSGSGPR